MITAVSIRSSSSGSGNERNIPLFILLASSFQFDIPTNATLLIALSSYSNLEWITFNGLCGDISAKPISSKNIIDITSVTALLASPCVLFVSTFVALSNNCNTLSDVDVALPWNEVTIKRGYRAKKLFCEFCPFIALHKNCTLNDLLHPGLPHIKTGILFITHTNKVNIFSSKAAFFAIPCGTSIWSIIYIFSLWTVLVKLLISFSFCILNIPSIILANCFRSSFWDNLTI